MTSARDTAMQKLEAKMLQRMLGRPIREHLSNMRGAIPAVYAEANTSHETFPLGYKFGFSAALLKKDKYISLHNTVSTGIAATSNLATTWLFTHPIRPYMYDVGIYHGEETFHDRRERNLPRGSKNNRRSGVKIKSGLYPCLTNSGKQTQQQLIII